jgi:hypothetical protein
LFGESYGRAWYLRKAIFRGGKPPSAVKLY